VCALHCAQLLHTILHRTDVIIFPLTLQTITAEVHWGSSRLCDQGMVAMLGGSRPNPLCECAIVVNHQKLHMPCVISLGTPPLRGKLTVLGYGGVELFRGLLPIWGG